MNFARLALGAVSLAATAAAAQVSLPPGFELIEAPGQMIAPTAVSPVPGGGALVAEKRGTVRWFAADGSLQQPFVVDLREEVGSFGERGLLGMAIDPNFVPDGGDDSWLYLLYTVSGLLGEDVSFDFEDYYGWSRLTRYRVQLGPFGTPSVDPTSRQILLGERLPDGRAPDAIASLHNSHSNGSLLFAPDGTLLITAGEGAHFETLDPGGIDAPGFDTFTHPVTGLLGPIPFDQDSGVFRSQDLRSLSGKVLRIDPDTGLGLSSNPFFTGDPADNASRVWGLGLRNPFRAALQPGTGALDPASAAPGRLYVADVGFALFEEITLFDQPGLNGSWPCFEGLDPQVLYGGYERPEPNPLKLPDCVTANPGTTRDPLIVWSHEGPFGSIPQGITSTWDGTPTEAVFATCTSALGFADNCGFPPLFEGQLFAADLNYGWLTAIELDEQGQPIAIREFGEGLVDLVDIRTAGDGSGLYMLDLAPSQDGRLLTLRYTGSGPDVAWQVPAAGSEIPWSGSLDLSDLSVSSLGLALTRQWTLSHVVPGESPRLLASSESDGPLAYSAAPDESGPSWFRLELQVTDTYGQSASLARTFLPADFARDATGGLDPLGAALAAPGPAPAQANPDFEVLRDGRLPDSESPAAQETFTSEHPAGPFAEDDLGYATRDGGELWFYGLTWTAGLPDTDGGWWVEPRVEVRNAGVWTAVSELEATPAYPAGQTPDALLEVAWRFAPISGDALRVIGAPAGDLQFVSASELRAYSVTAPDRTRFDASPLASVAAKLFELDPPQPLGPGSSTPETLLDGTRPAEGGSSLWAQFDSEHAGDQGADDWLGLTFGKPVTLDRFEFTEGVHRPGGGWFEGPPTLEIQRLVDGPWEALAPERVSPAYDSVGGGPDYRTFTYDFAPEIVRGVRLAGEPGGSVGFLSAGELRASGPGFTLAECGWQRYGDEVPLHGIDLDSACALQPGLAGRVDVAGAPGSGTGVLGIAIDASQVPLVGGQVLLLELAGLQFELLDFDAAGRASYAFTLPASGLSVHTPAYLQAAYLDPLFPGGWRLSNGLIATPCFD
ncbi:MAG: PQQ-dependent sugar dehydrogenase [Planctomycetota bacterium]